MVNDTLEQETLGGAARGGLVLQRGAMLDRFVLLERLGAGGMGVVYSAYDGRLDRRVALKLLRPDAWGPVSSEAGRERLLREAQAMARLSHPNVVTVYEVGSFEGQLFVAMEYVEGQTLRAWLKESPRAWPEVVRVLGEAGRGLAAAHQKGLVHRDFKPENVLVGADGRVRVTDFGLVRPAGSTPGPASGSTPVHDGSGGSGGEAPSLLTGSGMVLGTPGYIAPEQYLGREVDARADQFSFCATLYEGLFGQRPFQASTHEALREAVLQGQRVPPPGDSDVPGALRALVLTGLSTEPAARFASMEALLARLERTTTGGRTRRRVLAAALACVVAASGVQWYRTTAQVCSGAQAKLAGVWDDGVKAAVRRALLATGKAYAADTATRVEQVLDAYARAWVGMHTEACEATAVRKEQSAQLLDLRMQCLARRRGDLGALASLLQKADGSALEKVAEAAETLPSVSQCADAEALLAVAPLPDSPGVRAQVESLRARLSEVGALTQLGRFKEGLPLASALAEEAARVGYRPLLAEALLRRGELEAEVRPAAEAQKTLLDAALTASWARDDRLVVRALTRRVTALGEHEERRETTDEAMHALSLAAARVGREPALQGAVSRLGAQLAGRRGEAGEALARYEEALQLYEEAGDERQVGLVLGGLGQTLRELGRFSEARARLTRGLDLLERVLGPSHPDVARMLSALGAVSWKERNLEAARKDFERALHIREATYGPDSPQVAALVGNLGVLLLDQWRLDEAQAHFERALDIQSRTVGPRTREVGNMLNSLGGVFRRKGQPAKARDCHMRALSIFDDYFGKAGVQQAQSSMGIAQAYSDEGAHTRAIQWMRRAIALYEKSLGPGHVDTAVSYSALGSLLHAAGRQREAYEAYTRARTLLEKAGGPEHPSLFFVHDGLANTLLALERPREALVQLRRAEAVRGQLEWGPEEKASHQFSLGRIFWGLGEDRAAARRLVLEARDILAGVDRPRAARERGAVEAWLAAHPG